jgi:hypothetical protein
MIVFENENKTCCFVHIPKNSGRYIRDVIAKNFKVLQTFWHSVNPKKYGLTIPYIDTAHIPIDMFLQHFYTERINEFIAYTRNPYDRLISAYFYNYGFGRLKKLKNMSEEERALKFQTFIKSDLVNSSFDKYIYPRHNRLGGGGVHFAKQSLFLRIPDSPKYDFRVKIIKLENISNNETMWNNFKLKNYDLNLYYDDESIEIVNKLYDEDFKKLGYEKIKKK